MSEQKSDPSQLVAESPDRAPLAGKYQLLARLGQGGMSDVYLASMRGPLGFNKLLVLKRLRNLEDDGQALEMFLDEARLAARLKHPNIVDTYDVGQEVDTYFIAMEYLEGQPLSRILKATRTMDVHPTVWVHIVAEALHGLHHGHELRDYDGTPLEFVHRDISPHNIFVTYEAEVKVVDFGIAKTKLSVSQTESGFLKGKIGYMAPEQALREGLDRRSDIFAMGVVLWEALAGRRPFEGDVATILAKLAHVDIPKLADLRPDVDPQLIRIVERALKRYPNDRFSSAAEMRDALLKYLSTVPVAATKSDVARTMTTLFAEHRLSVQREIEKQLTNAAQPDASVGNFWESSRINISYENQTVPPHGSGHPPQRTPSVAPASLNQAFSATPLRAATVPPPSTSQRTILTVLAAIALLAGGGSVLVLRYMRPSGAPASTAVAEKAPTRALTPENPAPPAVNAPVPALPTARIAVAAPAPAVANPVGRSTPAPNRRETSAEIVRSFPTEPPPSRGTSSRRSAAASNRRSTTSLESPAPAPPPAVTPPPAPAVAPAPSPPGSLDSKAVAATIRAHSGEVQDCLERARMNRPDLQGRMSIQSTIGPDGHVLSTSVTSTIEGGSRLQSCVQSAWQGWTFPAPAGGVNGTVRKIFNFE